MHFFKIISLCLAAATVAGCASEPTAIPNFYNGRYFMAGDNNCARMKMANQNQIHCFNTEGQHTGLRNAMTTQQLQMYQHQQQMRAAEQQALINQMANASASIANSTPQYQMNRPTVQPAPLSMPGSNQINCINTGRFTNCRY